MLGIELTLSLLIAKRSIHSFILVRYIIEMIYSIRVDAQHIQTEDLIKFTDYDKFSAYIIAFENYSPKTKRDCKDHYHIGLITQLKKTSISTRLLKMFPHLKSIRTEACKYNLKVFDDTPKDQKHWLNYHCKGRGLGIFNILRSTYPKNILEDSNRAYWQDKQNFIEKQQEKKKNHSYSALLEYIISKQDYFLYDRETFDGGRYDELDYNFIPITRRKTKIFNREKLLDLIIDFYKGAIQYPILELRYNQLLYHYSKDTLLNDLKSRFTQYRSLTEIFISIEDIEDASEQETQINTPDMETQENF